MSHRILAESFTGFPERKEKGGVAYVFLLANRIASTGFVGLTCDGQMSSAIAEGMGGRH